MRSRQPAIGVTAFVDWNTQMHDARTLALDDPLERARQTLEKTTRAIGRALAHADSRQFRVSFRLYHGWHKGWEPTDNLRAVIQAVAERGSAIWRNVVFSANVGYGHTLLSALPGRLSSRSIHLPGTLRQQGPHLSPVEKMVDAALAADLLYWAFSDIGDWALVLSNDDDVIPPVLTAEAKTAAAGRRVFILKTARWQSHLMDLRGLFLETG